ncbi:MAG: extracellular solute-binding protein [Anaerolineae bacterium]|nr:extracellular solute-binding protein [Anaerolineae bacterium]
MNCHSKRHRPYEFWLLVILLLQGLFSCQQTEIAPQNSPDTLTSTPISPSLSQRSSSVTIYFSTYDSAVYAYKSLAEEFHTLNPNIRVEVFAAQDVGSAPSYEELLYRTVSEADTGLWWIDHLATRDGLVRDLSPFIEADAGFDANDFYPTMLDTFRWDDGVWALPHAATLGLIYYDRKAFDDAGIPYPQVGWTMADFLQIAQQMTLREGEETLRYGFVDMLNAGRESFILGQAGALKDPTTGLPVLNSDPVTRAVRWYTDLTLIHGVMPDPSTDASISGYELVQNGRAAMWSATLGTTYGSEMVVREIGSVPFPEADYSTNWATTNGYFMSQGTTHPQESWLWLNFLTHRQVAIWNYLMPARRSVVEQTQYWAQFEPEEAAAAKHAAENLNVLMWDEASLTLTKELPRIFKGESSETVLVEAQEIALELHGQWAQTPPKKVVVTPRELAPDNNTATVAFAPPSYLENQSNWAIVAEAFNHEHPGMRVKIVDLNAGTIDCFADNAPVLKNIGTPTMFLNIQSLLEAESDFSLEGIPEHFQNALSYQGALWGLPFQAQAYAIYYDRKLFDDAGLSYPQPSWTLNDFLNAAQQLTRGGAVKQWGYLPLNAPSEDLRIFLAIQGVKLWGEDGQPRFDAPDVVAAVAWYTDMALKYQVMPTFAEDFPNYQSATAQAQQTLLAQGQAAMWSSYTGQNPSSQNKQIGIASLPVNAQNQGIAVFRYEGFFISSETPHPEICWEWIQYLALKTELIQGIPARTGLLNAPLLQSQLGEEATAAYDAMLNYSPLPALSLSESAQIYQFYEAIGEILNGASPETALGKAQQEALP